MTLRGRYLMVGHSSALFLEQPLPYRDISTSLEGVTLMKRFLLAIAFTFVLSISALAGETNSPPGIMNGPPGETGTPTGISEAPPGISEAPPGIIGSPPGILATIILTIITWPR